MTLKIHCLWSQLTVGYLHLWQAPATCSPISHPTAEHQQLPIRSSWSGLGEDPCSSELGVLFYSQSLQATPLGRTRRTDVVLGCWIKRMFSFLGRTSLTLWHCLHQMCPLLGFVPDHLNSKQHERVKLGNRSPNRMVWEMEDREFTAKSLPHSPETDWWTDSLLGRQTGSVSLKGQAAGTGFSHEECISCRKNKGGDVGTTLIRQTFNRVLHKAVGYKMTWKTCFNSAVWETNRKTATLCHKIDLFFFFSCVLASLKLACAPETSACLTHSAKHKSRLLDTVLCSFSADNFTWSVRC